MATYQPSLGFDTLGFAQALIAKGYEQKQAEALAIVTRDYVIRGMATNEFVHATIQEAKTEIKQGITEVNHKIDTEIERAKAEIKQEITKLDGKINTEIALLENRMNKTNVKMLAFAVGVMLAGIPIIQAVIAKLG